MVTVLFTQPGSHYYNFDTDCYDIARDARLYTGSSAVICHPPCRSWGQLRHISHFSLAEHNLAIFAVIKVQKNGGIIEHPVGSKLFGSILPYPGLKDNYGGYTICIDQHWFGYPARKKTLLYIVGIPENKLPPIPISFDAITHKIGGTRKKSQNYHRLKEVSKSTRSLTPIALCQWLIETASLINSRKNQ